jgi:hypothetical protein
MEARWSGLDVDNMLMMVMVLVLMMVVMVMVMVRCVVVVARGDWAGSGRGALKMWGMFGTGRLREGGQKKASFFVLLFTISAFGVADSISCLARVESSHNLL